MTTWGDLMTKNPSYCLPTDTAFRAAQLMRDEDVGSVPIVDNHQTKTLVGIVTDRDLAIRIVAPGRSNEATVEEVMSAEPVVCRPDDNLQSALDAMRDAQVRRIPVVDGGERLVGIISQADVATRIRVPRKTGEVVEGISTPRQMEH